MSQSRLPLPPLLSYLAFTQMQPGAIEENYTSQRDLSANKRILR